MNYIKSEKVIRGTKGSIYADYEYIYVFNIGVSEEEAKQVLLAEGSHPKNPYDNFEVIHNGEFVVIRREVSSCE